MIMFIILKNFHNGVQRTGLCAGGEFNVPSARTSAEYRIKKLIICSFADRITSARTAGDSSTKLLFIPSAPLAQNPVLVAVFSLSLVVKIFFNYALSFCSFS